MHLAKGLEFRAVAVMACDDEVIPLQDWLEMDGALLDVTTDQLRLKAAQLDAQDGGHTTVEWCPDFLFVPKSTIASQRDVVQQDTGMYYYERHLATERRVLHR